MDPPLLLFLITAIVLVTVQSVAHLCDLSAETETDRNISYTIFDVAITTKQLQQH